MKIDHIAIWTKDLEKMRKFYTQFFGAKSSDMYHNRKKNFSSYFISFESGTRIELMHNPDIFDAAEKVGLRAGLTHLAVSVGSRDMVNTLTEKARDNGYEILGEPRVTGDGYYESVIADPEVNRIELTE